MRGTIRTGVAFLASYGAGLVGFYFVDSQVSTWYAALVKPALMPPPEAFAVVWLILYGLMACALAIIWNIEPQTPRTEGWVRFFFIQLLFNAAWTMFFFGFHSVIFAFIDILLLAFTVSGLIVDAWEIKCRGCVYLMLPYLAWILFAAYLTLGIWILN